MNLLLTAFWFFLPAGVANMGPVLIKQLPFLRNWNTPMDFGLEHHGKRIFGAHKTWRGLLGGIVFATLIIALQRYLFTRNLWVLEHSWFDYRPSNVWLIGVLFGAGAIIGDAVESFFKRQRGVPSGDSWFPFDQIDYIIGGLLFTALFTQPSLSLAVNVFIVYFGLHLLTSYVAFRVGLKDKPI